MARERKLRLPDDADALLVKMASVNGLNVNAQINLLIRAAAGAMWGQSVPTLSPERVQTVPSVPMGGGDNLGTNWGQSVPTLSPERVQTVPSGNSDGNIKREVYSLTEKPKTETTLSEGGAGETKATPKKARPRVTILEGERKARFDLFWLGGTLSDGTAYRGYPKKEGVGAAEKAFAAFDPDLAETERWCKMVDRWRLSRKWREDFIKDAVNWINERCWDPRNDPSPPAQAPISTPSDGAHPEEWYNFPPGLTEEHKARCRQLGVRYNRDGRPMRA